MKDPLISNDQREQKLFEQVNALLIGVPVEVVRSIAMNLVVGSIREYVPFRKDAEQIMDGWFGRAKSTLLDFHYDPVTGRRRAMFPFTQTIEMPFHVDQDAIFPPKR